MAAFREGGYAVDFTGGSLREVIVGQDHAAVWNGFKGSFIRNLHGFSGVLSGEKTLEDMEKENTHAEKSATPVIIGGEIPPGLTVVVSLSGTFFTRDRLGSLLGLVQGVSVDGRKVAVRFADGSKEEMEF